MSNKQFFQGEVYLPPKKPNPTFTANGNLLEKFGLLTHFEQLRKSSQYINVSETFRPYISHLPDPLDDVIKEAQKEGPFGSFSRITLNEQLDNTPSEFSLFKDTQLQNSFTLRVGPIIRVLFCEISQYSFDYLIFHFDKFTGR